MCHFLCTCLLLSFDSLPFFFNDTATTEIYTLSLHDALPISISRRCEASSLPSTPRLTTTSSAACSLSRRRWLFAIQKRDRKSTRLNSSHMSISYAVFCLKKKKKNKKKNITHKTITYQHIHTT